MDGPSPQVLERVVAQLGAGGRVEVLGRGMEGTVVALDADRVAKVWTAGVPARLEQVRAVLDAPAVRALPFATPRVEAVTAVDGWTVTVERRLRGVPLSERLAAGAVRVGDALDAVVDVAVALAGAGDVPAARALPVLDEPGALYAVGDEFASALGGLVRRRLHRFHAVLAAAVPDLDVVVDALLTRLPEVDSGARSLLHGDLFPGNVLVDDDRTSAVLDWGFLTTVGDPAFDAAVTAAIFDMYGEHALANERTLAGLLQDAAGHDAAAMLVYRAAYSVVTANAYSDDGSDGHFAWCVAALRRPDVLAALGR